MCSCLEIQVEEPGPCSQKIFELPPHGGYGEGTGKVRGRPSQSFLLASCKASLGLEKTTPETPHSDPKQTRLHSPYSGQKRRPKNKTQEFCLSKECVSRLHKASLKGSRESCLALHSHKRHHIIMVRTLRQSKHQKEPLNLRLSITCFSLLNHLTCGDIWSNELDPFPRSKESYPGFPPSGLGLNQG